MSKERAILAAVGMLCHGCWRDKESATLGHSDTCPAREILEIAEMDAGPKSVPRRKKQRGK